MNEISAQELAEALKYTITYTFIGLDDHFPSHVKGKLLYAGETFVWVGPDRRSVETNILQMFSLWLHKKTQIEEDKNDIYK